MNESMPNSVNIQVKLGERPQELRVPDGTLCGDLYLHTKLAPKWRDHVLVVVNGRIAGSDVYLRKGDRVVILPKMSGG
jgi:molybdopterin converting factor small subunit